MNSSRHVVNLVEHIWVDHNCFKPPFQSEAMCTTFHMKISFHSRVNKTIFLNIKGVHLASL